MSHSLPLPISARKGSARLRDRKSGARGPAPTREQSPQGGLSGPARGSQILLHPRAEMAPPASSLQPLASSLQPPARSDSGPGCVPTWKASSAGPVGIEQVCDRFVLEDARPLQPPSPLAAPLRWPEVAFHPGEPPEHLQGSNAENSSDGRR